MLIVMLKQLIQLMLESCFDFKSKDGTETIKATLLYLIEKMVQRRRKSRHKRTNTNKYLNRLSMTADSMK